MPNANLSNMRICRAKASAIRFNADQFLVHSLCVIDLALCESDLNRPRHLPWRNDCPHTLQAKLQINGRNTLHRHRKESGAAHVFDRMINLPC